MIAQVRSQQLIENNSDIPAHGIYLSVKLFSNQSNVQNKHNDEELQLWCYVSVPKSYVMFGLKIFMTCSYATKWHMIKCNLSASFQSLYLFARTMTLKFSWGLEIHVYIPWYRKGGHVYIPWHRKGGHVVIPPVRKGCGRNMIKAFLLHQFITYDPSTWGSYKLSQGAAKLTKYHVCPESFRSACTYSMQLLETLKVTKDP